MLLRELTGQKEIGLLILIRLTPYFELHFALHTELSCYRQIIAMIFGAVRNRTIASAVRRDSCPHLVSRARAPSVVNLNRIISTSLK